MDTTVILAQLRGKWGPSGSRLRRSPRSVPLRSGIRGNRCKPVGEKNSGGPFFRSEIKKSLRLFTKTTVKKRSVKES